MAAFSAETLLQVGQFPITNSLLDTFIVDSLIIWGILSLQKMSMVPGVFQNVIEIAVDGFYNLTANITPKHVGKIFPWFMSFFVVIFLSNWSGLIPGFGTIGFYHEGELIPYLRAATSDINTTVGYAILSVFITQAMGIGTVGLKEYISRYVSWNPINLFVGILEFVGIFTSIISLSFRLFGNIFAGEVLLSTISSIFAFILPLPFLMLEVIVGFVQALVFSMLTMVAMSIITTPHHEGGETNESSH